MSETQKSEIVIGTITFGKLVAGGKIQTSQNESEGIKTTNLTIPNYQRPYAWGEKQVEILLNDLKEVAERGEQGSPYLLGSLIFHCKEVGKENAKLEIVDGQQRLVTLALICKELSFWQEDNGEWKRKSNLDGETGNQTRDFLMNQDFPHAQSQKNIKNNFAYIKKWFERHSSLVPSFQALGKDGDKNDKIEFVCIVSNNLDDAFIFFDSANAKGKKLEDYDLIKAYHLRELSERDQGNSLAYYAKFFESLAKESGYLSLLFDRLLTPARLWIRDRSELISGDMAIYDEFCQEIPQRFTRSTPSSQDLGILSSFAGGVDFFCFLQRFDKHLKCLKSRAFFQELEKIGGSGFGYTRELYAIAAMIYLDKFPCGRSDFMLMLLARAVFEIRIQRAVIYQATIRDYAKKLLPLIYCSSFEEELECKLLAFISEQDKEGEIGKHNGGKNAYLELVQKTKDSHEPQFPFSDWEILDHRT